MWEDLSSDLYNNSWATVTFFSLTIGYPAMIVCFFKAGLEDIN
jgi:hypothetical protein